MENNTKAVNPLCPLCFAYVEDYGCTALNRPEEGDCFLFKTHAQAARDAKRAEGRLKRLGLYRLKEEYETANKVNYSKHGSKIPWPKDGSE